MFFGVIGLIYNFFQISKKFQSIHWFFCLISGKVNGLSAIPGSDFDPAVLSAYINQFTAEAQEITVARAIELKHSPGLISALAQETSQLFVKAGKQME